MGPVSGGIVTGQVRYQVGKGGFAISAFNDKVTAFKELVLEGLAEWEPHVINHVDEGIQPFLIWTVKVK